MPREVNGATVVEQSMEWAQLAFALAFFAGCMQLMCGLFRFGFVVNFVSEAVIVAFTNGAAFLIAATQVWPLPMCFCNMQCLLVTVRVCAQLFVTLSLPHSRVLCVRT